MFFFRNEKVGPECLTDPCGINSINNAPAELAFMSANLPPGRKLQLGVYFVPLSRPEPMPPEVPSVLYDYNLVHLAMSQPALSGITAYSMQSPSGAPCNDFNYLQSGFCTLWKNWGSVNCTPGATQSCGNCGTQTCLSNQTWGACSNQGVCVPGATSTVACGDHCGTRTDTCSTTCQWQIGACGSEGVCSPGESQECCECPGGACSCWGFQSCTSSCTWGTCFGDTCGTNACE